VYLYLPSIFFRTFKLLTQLKIICEYIHGQFLFSIFVFVYCICAISEASLGRQYNVGIRCSRWNVLITLCMGLRLKFIHCIGTLTMYRGTFRPGPIAATVLGPIYFELNKRSTIFEIQSTFSRVQHEKVKKNK